MTYPPPSAPAVPGEFIQPSDAASSTTQFDIKAHIGSLVLIDVVEMMEQVTTAFGIADGAKVTVRVLSGPGAGATHPDVALWQRAIVPLCRTAYVQKRPLAGRITLGQAAPGRSAPYLLEDPSPEEATRIRAMLAGTPPHAVAAPQSPAYAAPAPAAPAPAYVPPTGHAAAPVVPTVPPFPF